MTKSPALNLKTLKTSPSEIVWPDYVGATDVDPDNIMKQATQANTVTKSRIKKTKREDVWTKEVEEVFVELGGKTLNEKLGYEE